MTERKYDLVDLFKLIASILVFTMHMEALKSLGSDVHFYSIELLSRWGVPFFFITSSFLLFQKSQNGNITKDVLMNYIKRIALLYLVWFIFNLPQVAYYHIIVSGITNVETYLMLAKKLLFSSSFTGSWYLTSSIFSACFVYLLCKKISTKATLIISSVLYMVCILTSAYGRIIPEGVIANINQYFAIPANSIICGCFFFALGKYLAENKHILEKISIKLCVAGVAIFGILYYLEIALAKNSGWLISSDASVFVVPWALFIVFLCLKSNCKLKYSTQMRKLSTVIYCSQGLLMLAAKFICEIILSITNTLIIYAVGATMVAACCFVVLLLQKKTKFKWCRYLT